MTSEYIRHDPCDLQARVTQRPSWRRSLPQSDTRRRSIIDCLRRWTSRLVRS